MLSEIGKIILLPLFVGASVGIGKAWNVSSSDKEKELIKVTSELKHYKKRTESLNKQIDSLQKNFTEKDTSLAWVHGYNQAKTDNACSYSFKDNTHSFHAGNGRCKYTCVKEISSITSEKKIFTGGGETLDSEIFAKPFKK